MVEFLFFYSFSIFVAHPKFRDAVWIIPFIFVPVLDNHEQDVADRGEAIKKRWSMNDPEYG
jgi:hypothetical protein